MKEEFLQNSLKRAKIKQWPCNLLKDKYTLEREIGHGAYGSVYQAKDIDGNKLAIKKMENFQQKQDKQGRSFGFPITTMRQIKLLQNMNHPNILNIKDVAFQRHYRHKTPTIYICLDLMDSDLNYLVQQSQYNFTNYRLQCIIRQILEGLSYLHNSNIAHRDLKPSNILINEEGILKIADFGLAKKLTKLSTSRVVTMWYRAPQLLLGLKTYSTNIDIWSLGCIVAEFFLRKPLFYESQTQRQIISLIYKRVGTPDKCDWQEVQKLQVYQDTKPQFSQESQILYYLKKTIATEQEDLLLDLIEKMLRLNPQSRYSAEECLAHPYFMAKYEEEEIVSAQIFNKKKKIDQGHDYVGKKVKHN